MTLLLCPLADARKGGPDRSFTLEDPGTLPGHVATVACSHHALFLNLLNPGGTAVPGEAEEGSATLRKQSQEPAPGPGPNSHDITLGPAQPWLRKRTKHSRLL